MSCNDNTGLRKVERDAREVSWRACEAGRRRSIESRLAREGPIVSDTGKAYEPIPVACRRVITEDILIIVQGERRDLRYIPG